MGDAVHIPWGSAWIKVEYSHELAKQITLQKEKADSKLNQKYWSGGFETSQGMPRFIPNQNLSLMIHPRARRDH